MNKILNRKYIDNGDLNDLETQLRQVDEDADAEEADNEEAEEEVDEPVYDGE
jgi:hypothetical protein